jgi:hypothetical protein
VDSLFSRAIDSRASIAQTALRAPYSESPANLLMSLRAKLRLISECFLKLLANHSVLETGALAIELHSYGPDEMPVGGGQSKSPAGANPNRF